MTKRAFLFGYGRHGRAIADGLKMEHFRVVILESEEINLDVAKDDGFLDTTLIDVTKDSQLEALNIEDDDKVICVMDDEHLNVFLTLSLRSIYENCFLLSISDSIHTTQKLKKAGANRVISLYEVSANRIHNILKRPTATQLLDGFVTNHSDISFKEMTIPAGSMLDGKMADDINFGEHRVLLIGMIDEELSHGFLFITAGVEHKIDAGDTIVCIGDDEDLKEFEKSVVNRPKVEELI
ncbi:Potassium channel protein [hydrothermal vent metagenome]|uniref:Potassium channel protein n=1 Tax=hydrothermal vent metagenome TaxID=652676 RepID=A0A1W1BEZ1_9ZZZZ